MDNADSKILWDRKYKEGLPSLTAPDPYFLSVYESHVESSFPNAGRALDLAAGLGRHTLWLAKKGWQVSAVDISEIALGKLYRAAGPLKANINLFAIDAAEYTFEPVTFDLIVLFYHLDRTLFSKIVHALNPSAVFICKMAIQWSSETAVDKTQFTALSRNELPSLVPGLKAISYHERPVKDRGVVEFAGTKSD